MGRCLSISTHRVKKRISKNSLMPLQVASEGPIITKTREENPRTAVDDRPLHKRTRVHCTYGSLPAYLLYSLVPPIYKAKNILQVHFESYSPCSYQHLASCVCVEINVYLEKYNLLTVRLALCVECIFISIFRAASGYSYGPLSPHIYSVILFVSMSLSVCVSVLCLP